MVRDQLPLVVAVPDGDDEALLRFAAWESLVHGCAVRLVHVRPDDGDDARAEDVVESAIARTELLAGPGIMVTGTVIAGQPVASVLESCGAVLGVAVRERDVLHLMRAISDDERPGGDPAIACVPSSWRVPEHGGPVLLGVDDVDDVEAASDLIGRALAIADAHGTSLRVLHAWCFPGRYRRMLDDRVGEQWGDQVRASLDRAVARARSRGHTWVPVETVVEHGVAADLLVEAARDAQLLVIERNPAGDGPEHVGRTTRTALHACPCPVVLLPRTARP